MKKCFIDTRFPQQPKRILVPLYPTEGMIKDSCALFLRRKQESLETIIAYHYQVSEEHVMLREKASQALMLFLKWFSNEHARALRVGIPSFCCPDVCLAILAAGCIPVFLDSEQDLSLRKESVYFAHQQGCKVILWPQFFGEREQKHLDLIDKLGMLFIDDEAQSFPGKKGSDKRGVSLFSFGHSKKLAGIGGGGLCVHDKKMAESFFSSLESENTTRIKASEVYDHMKAILRRRLIDFNRPLVEKCGMAPKLEVDLKVLLEKTLKLKDHVNAMSQYQKEVALKNYQRFFSEYETYCDRTKQLKDILLKSPQKVNLNLLEEIEAPSIFSIRVSSEMRFNMSNFFARDGVQTTWYYYPLNRLPIFSSYISEETPVSDAIASEVLVLPFQWKHSQRHVDRLCEVVLKLT